MGDIVARTDGDKGTSGANGESKFVFTAEDEDEDKVEIGIMVLRLFAAASMLAIKVDRTSAETTGACVSGHVAASPINSSNKRTSHVDAKAQHAASTTQSAEGPPSEAAAAVASTLKARERPVTGGQGGCSMTANQPAVRQVFVFSFLFF